MRMPAARMTDMHLCPAVCPGPIPHVGGPILPPCEASVLIGGLPAARVSDRAVCACATDSLVHGSATVRIGGQSAARIGDASAHGGRIVAGLASVLIGDDGSGDGGGGTRAALIAAAAAGVPFCEACLDPPTRQVNSLLAAAEAGASFCEDCEASDD